MPAMVIGDFEVDRFFGVAGAEPDIGVAALAVAFERVARHRSAVKQQVIEVRHAAFGTITADIVDALAGGTLDLVDGFRRGRLRRGATRVRRQRVLALVSSRLVDVRSCRGFELSRSGGTFRPAPGR